MIKNPPANTGDLRDVGLIPGSGGSCGEGNGNPLQCSCLENTRDRGAWWAAIYRVAQSRTRLKQLSSSSEIPRWFSGKESACQYRRHKRCGFDPWVRKIPWRRKWQSTLAFLPGESHGQRILVVIHFKYSSVYMSIPNSLTIPSCCCCCCC